MSPLPRRPATSEHTVFITQVVSDRERILADTVACELLLNILRNVKALHPFTLIGYCILPDHFHLLIRPAGAESASAIMHSLKRQFTVMHKQRLHVSGRMNVWQKSFMDHVIRDDADLQSHLDYMHLNPVVHGLVARPEEWQWSSFVAWKQRGAYADGWAWPLADTMAAIRGQVEGG